MPGVSVEKNTLMLFVDLMRMHMGGGRLKQGKRQGKVQQERDEKLQRVFMLPQRPNGKLHHSRRRHVVLIE